MSDFLDHLLGQSQGPAASLAPRPLALHEPAPEPAAPPLDEAALAGGGLPGSDAFAMPRFRPAPSVAPPEPGQPPPDPAGEMRRRLDELQAWLGQLASLPAEPPALAGPSPAPGRAGGPAAQPAPGEDRPPAAVPAAPVTVVRQVTAHTPVSAALPTPAPAPAPPAGPAPVPLRVRPAPPEPQVEPRRAAHSPQAQAPAPPEPQVEPRRAARSPQAQAPAPAAQPVASPPAAPSPEAAPARLAPRPPEQAGVPAANRLPARQAAEPSSRPVVHVTIGRIEVRAARAPAPAVASPRPSPILSLEEYLRQRNGGSGR